MGHNPLNMEVLMKNHPIHLKMGPWKYLEVQAALEPRRYSFWLGQWGFLSDLDSATDS